MLRAIQTNAFEKDVELCKKRKLQLIKLQEVMRCLTEGEVLSAKYKDHKLSGSYAGCRDCHIQPDWLLIYKKTADAIIFQRTGTHSDLFR